MSGTAKMSLVLVLAAIILVGGVMVVLRGAQDISETDLGVVGNETVTGATDYVVTMSSAFRWFLLALAAIGLTGTLFYLGARR